mmetsp:Transcript_58422/g.139352  ORF Transcript_58422/g.139352 Transcript_58422/m.139352 type:complete len:100 (+) Transcript_58422:880-1179(+)
MMSQQRQTKRASLPAMNGQEHASLESYVAAELRFEESQPVEAALQRGSLRLEPHALETSISCQEALYCCAVAKLLQFSGRADPSQAKILRVDPLEALHC